MTKVLIYCTKGTTWKLEKVDCGYYDLLKDNTNKCLNGKVVAECEIECERLILGLLPFTRFDILKESCLSFEQLCEYTPHLSFHALHISNLKIFDRPMELSEFKTRHYPQFAGMVRNKTHYELKPLTNAPQNMMWVWLEDTQYCLISIRPEWVCKILNGEKTIEVRKKVLKGML